MKGNNGYCVGGQCSQYTTAKKNKRYLYFPVFQLAVTTVQLITVRRPSALRLIIFLAIPPFPQNEKLIQSVHKAGEKINIQHGSDFSKSNVTSLTKQKSAAK